jgi:hypothetical protein
VIAIAVNADTITLARSLSMDMAMRWSLAAAAAEYVNKTAASSADAKTKLDENLKQFQKLSLPLNWVAGDPRSIPVGSNPVPWFIKFIGWLLTATAISVGAPLWFDLLNKFINVRSSLKPPGKSSGA